MTFLSLLTKELRLRVRRERTIWIVIAYILFMGLLGWFSINSYNNASTYSNNNTLSSVGLLLYYLLSQLQLLLVIFITPAFTSTAINGEKERQTFDLLLCSRLSPFSLLFGKLLAGLMIALLLVAASAPLFSLVFFFGGVGPDNIVKALIVFIITTILMGTLGIFCSTIFQRPAVSTAVAYMICLLWIGLPLILSVFSGTPTGPVARPPSLIAMPTISPAYMVSRQLPFLLAINPITALSNTYPNGGMSYYSYANPFLVLTSMFYPNGIYIPRVGLNTLNLALFGLKPTAWQAYTILSLLLSTVLFMISLYLMKPANIMNRLRRLAKGTRETNADEATATT